MKCSDNEQCLNFLMYLYLEARQSTSKLITSGSSVPHAIYNTTRQKIRSKSEFFKLSDI